MSGRALGFFCPLRRIPGATAANGKRHAGKAVYDSPALAEARAVLEAAFAPHAPERPLEGPLEMRLVWQYPRGRHRQSEPKTTRPDLDNLRKLPQDVISKLGFMRDDACVWRIDDAKIWADPCGVYVEIRESDWRGEDGCRSKRLTS